MIPLANAVVNVLLAVLKAVLPSLACIASLEVLQRHIR